MADPITGLIVGGAITCGLGIMGIVYKANSHEFHARFNPFVQDITHRCWQYWLPIPEKNSEDASSEGSQGDIENQRHSYIVSHHSKHSTPTHSKNKKANQEDTHENSSDGSGDEIVVVVKHSKHSTITHQSTSSHSKHSTPENKKGNQLKPANDLYKNSSEEEKEDESFKSTKQNSPHQESKNEAIEDQKTMGAMLSFAEIAKQAVVVNRKKKAEEDRKEREDFAARVKALEAKFLLKSGETKEEDEELEFFDAESSSPVKNQNAFSRLNIEKPLREVEHHRLESKSSFSALDLAQNKQHKSKIKQKSSAEGYKGSLADILFPQKSSSSDQLSDDNLERMPSFRKGSLESDSSPTLDPGISIANQVRNMFGIPLQHESSPRSDDSSTSSIVFAGLESGDLPT